MTDRSAARTGPATADGALAGAMKVPDYESVEFEKSTDPVEPRVRRRRMTNGLILPRWLDDNALLVQYDVFDGGKRTGFMTRLLDMKTSWTRNPDQLPFVLYARGNTMIAATPSGNRVLTRYVYSR